MIMCSKERVLLIKHGAVRCNAQSRASGRTVWPCAVRVRSLARTRLERRWNRQSNFNSGGYMYAPIPMVKAWALTPTSVAETMSSRPGPDGNPGMQWQLDAAQPWSPQGFVSKFWLPQTEEKPTLNQQYWAVFRRPAQPRAGKDGTADWDYNWRIIEGGWNLTMDNAMNMANTMN